MLTVVGSLMAMPPPSRTLLQRVCMRGVTSTYLHGVMMGSQLDIKWRMYRKVEALGRCRDFQPRQYRNTTKRSSLGHHTFQKCGLTLLH